MVLRTDIPILIFFNVQSKTIKDIPAMTKAIIDIVLRRSLPIKMEYFLFLFLKENGCLTV